MLKRIRSAVRQLFRKQPTWPDGHFYSPIIGRADLRMFSQQSPAANLIKGGVGYCAEDQAAGKQLAFDLSAG